MSDRIAENKISICEAPYFKCQWCMSNLAYSTNKDCVVFTLNGAKKGLLRSKYCGYCKITYNADSY